MYSHFRRLSTYYENISRNNAEMKEKTSMAGTKYIDEKRTANLLSNILRYKSIAASSL